MTLVQVGGALLVFLLCPLVGGLPSIDWMASLFLKRRLSRVGTGNVSVSAAFYHGGPFFGILAVLSEASKGIFTVLLARAFFPSDPVWELVALMALVMGRYWFAKGAGTTNVVWGIVVHDPIAARLIALIGGISFTLLRERELGRYGILVLLAVIIGLRHSGDPPHVLGAIALASLLGLIYQRLPDDLDLNSETGHSSSSAMFRFFRGDRALLSLDRDLDASKVGQKASTLSRLKRWGYPVPHGWVLPAGDDPAPLLEALRPTPDRLLIVRSSAIGEDSETASAAGQYQTFADISDRDALRDAILRCFASYNAPTAIKYRQDRAQIEGRMSVLVQEQVRGVFSGVAFSRDPLNQMTDAVLIEGLPGEAAPVVSGRVTPQCYRVQLDSKSEIVEGEGDLPPGLVREVARMTRDLEDRFHGIPQDIEWTYDGRQLWLLQARPVTTLQPIWTRKIAAEVIPGAIAPLTWSVNRPLTCGVWGEIFTLVLGDRAADLDFESTATLHYSHAYFNATLLGSIFRRMGLPAESLEFLTRGAKFSKPPLQSTLRNIPGLLRLLGREWHLERDFDRDDRRQFDPILDRLSDQNLAEFSATELLDRVETILSVLKRATYYNILAPLSFAIRQAIWKVSDRDLDSTRTPEVASLRELAAIAADTRHILPLKQLSDRSCPSVFTFLAESPDAESVLEQFDEWLARYGYLSEAATDIAVPRWKENPRPARELFTEYLFSDRAEEQTKDELPPQLNWQTKQVQKRLELKAKVAEVYNRLLAHLRWTFVALAKRWCQAGILQEPGDIFYLKLSEIRTLLAEDSPQQREHIAALIQQRRSNLEGDRALEAVPSVVYGTPPARETLVSAVLTGGDRLKGIAASPGQAEGYIKILRRFQANLEIDRDTILVVPFTDSGWAPILSRAGGIISEVGGRLSHGAIVAREYGIPAVMDVTNATQVLRDGQKVRLDGQTGMVELSDP